jgi:hypothetical protein
MLTALLRRGLGDRFDVEVNQEERVFVTYRERHVATITGYHSYVANADQYSIEYQGGLRQWVDCTTGVYDAIDCLIKGIKQHTADPFCNN